MSAGKAVLEVFLLIVGFVLLVKGADFFVDGASGIAKKLKISTFIIGATVVALGTSAPEMAVTIVDAVGGKGDIIVGNITGSNIINIFLILGVSAIICNLPVEKTTRFVDLPFLIIVSVGFLLLGYFGGGFTWWEGIILILFYVAYMVYNVVLGLKQSKSSLEQATAVSTFEEEQSAEQKSGFWAKFKNKYEELKSKVWFLIVLTVIGLGMVVGGAELVVTYARDLAENLIGIPTQIVALTVVAFGTSLPELVTSVSAARKGDVGIATGNIIGSNIANTLLIGGLGAISSGKVGLALTSEGLVSAIIALFAAVLIFASCWGKTKSLTRVVGVIMLVCLVCYYGVVFLNLYDVIHLY